MPRGGIAGEVGEQICPPAGAAVKATRAALAVIDRLEAAHGPAAFYVDGEQLAPTVAE